MKSRVIAINESKRNFLLPFLFFDALSTDILLPKMTWFPQKWFRDEQPELAALHSVLAQQGQRLARQLQLLCEGEVERRRAGRGEPVRQHQRQAQKGQGKLWLKILKRDQPPAFSLFLFLRLL